MASADSTARIDEARNSNDLVRFSSDCEDWDDWDKPAPPFKVYGNTYYVGTCGIAAILITNGEDHALIDTGTETGAEIVMTNIEALGFELGDIWVLTASHEHVDHVGGMTKVQSRATSARVLFSKIGLNVLTSGRENENDPQAGMHDAMAPILANRAEVVGTGETRFLLGRYGLKYIKTPGHTPGALTWQWEACEGDVCKTTVYADSLSAISRDDYKFSDHPEYVAAFRTGIERLRALDCDILLTPHPLASNMIERAATGTFEGGMTCADYADSKMKALDERLAKEAAGE